FSAARVMISRADNDWDDFAGWGCETGAGGGGGGGGVYSSCSKVATGAAANSMEPVLVCNRRRLPSVSWLSAGIRWPLVRTAYAPAAAGRVTQKITRRAFIPAVGL